MPNYCAYQMGVFGKYENVLEFYKILNYKHPERIM